MFPRIQLLGSSVDVVTRQQVMNFIAGAIAEGRKAIVGNQNFHSLCLSRQSREMRDFYRACDLIEIDSTPLIFWGRLLGHDLDRQNRCTYLDWRGQFWRQAADRRWRVFCLGATEVTNNAAITRLADEFAGAVIAGRHGYFDQRSESDANREVVRAINAFRPDVILVGMGMPLQEAWILRNYASLQRGVVLSIGAALDYEAGAQSPAPRLLGALGLEWLYRLLHDPRRLAHRYLIEPWALAPLAGADLAQRRAAAAVRSDPRVQMHTPASAMVNAIGPEDANTAIKEAA